ncbi:MAG: PorV/PorQ family protein [Elusimicrobia bacterium]|nr:PorV/PorQ family protein [Elusimicrobiota bacterium]
MKITNKETKNEVKGGKMYKMLSAMILALMVVSIICTGKLQAGVGSSAMEFLKLGIGAKQEGMGGAQVAVAEDVNSVYWNPAGLGSVSATELSFMHLSYFEGISYEYLAIGHPINESSTIGLQIMYLNYGSMDKTLENSAGGYDAVGSVGSFEAKDIGGAISYGKQVDETINVGGSLKMVSQKIDTNSASGFGLDLGVEYVPVKGGLQLGLAVQNLGGKVDSNSLPGNIKAGLGKKLSAFEGENNLTMAADVNYELDTATTKENIGLELMVAEMVAIRAGYKIGYDEESYTLGGGFKMSGASSTFNIDYAFVPTKDLGDTHRVSLGIRFGGKE